MTIKIIIIFGNVPSIPNKPIRMKQIKEHIYEWVKFWIQCFVTLNRQDDNTFIFCHMSLS